ncbi:MAG: hypothetical protein JOS17DRAFT_758291 [Linnemannia elongata]|nr:MAG: hypothetical protein JOS17DRAFT_758291 [Linnemannia elongata]
MAAVSPFFGFACIYDFVVLQSRSLLIGVIVKWERDGYCVSLLIVLSLLVVLSLLLFLLLPLVKKTLVNPLCLHEEAGKIAFPSCAQPRFLLKRAHVKG